MLVEHFLQPAIFDSLIGIDILAFTCGRRVRPARLEVESNRCDVTVSDNAAVLLSGFNLHTQNSVVGLVNGAQVAIGVKVLRQTPTLTGVRSFRVLSGVDIAVCHFRWERRAALVVRESHRQGMVNLAATKLINANLGILISHTHNR